MKIERTITVEGFRAYVDAIRACGDHPMPTLTDAVLDSVVEVLACYLEVADGYEDTEGTIVVRLADGSIGVFSEWSDSSGHG